uniref:GGDEF domain-containing protein n=1 Tax=Angiostrongylus cantonensis TaxID=6313 RepID=A0A0K0CUZ1_ANGCA
MLDACTQSEPAIYAVAQQLTDHSQRSDFEPHRWVASSSFVMFVFGKRADVDSVLDCARRQSLIQRP